MRIDPDVSLPEGSFGNASTILLVDARGRVLLQQRDDNHPPEGYGRWAFAGGGWEAGESPRQTALREMQEETGLNLQQLRYFQTFEFGIGTHGFPVAWHVFFSFEPVDDESIEVNEGLAFTFWSPEQIDSLRINPWERRVLAAFFASSHYQDGLNPRVATAAVSVIALDRWGRILLQLRDRDLPPHLHPGTWTLPGGALEEGESPDIAAVREFQEETGHFLERISLYRVFRREDIPGQTVEAQHVYFIDADLDIEMLECLEGLELRYFAPGELNGLDITPWTKPVLDTFPVSPAYKRLFH
jgi:8-oxo-dGTP pyrophosphatase MutT (NUDIX family)